MTQPAIIFDFGGVLIDWNPRRIFRDYFSSAAEMESFLAETRFNEWNAEQDKGRTFAEGVALFSAQYPQYAEIIRDFHARWAESVSGSITGSVEILLALQKSGCALYGLSNWSAETFPLTQSQFPFFEVFNGILLSGEVQLIKPDPAIFELCLQMTGKPAAECLFIDDSSVNIQAAQRMGFDVIRFTSSAELQAELKSRNLL